MKLKHTITYSLLVLISLFTSCKKQPVPAYLYVPEFTVTAELDEGSASHKITDVWVFQDGNQQGAYELPAVFPIIAEGPTTLILFGGVKLNGIGSTRAIYSFYEPDTILVDFSARQTDTIFPSVKYRKNIKFDFIEDFETPADAVFTSLRFESDPGNIFEGNASGRLKIDSAVTEVIAGTKASFVIKPLNGAVFLEMDYKSNHLFTVGIKGFSGTNSFTLDKLNISPKEEWNKIYINFTPDVDQIQASSYEIYLKATANNVSPDSIEIFVDNLKLISFRQP